MSHVLSVPPAKAGHVSMVAAGSETRVIHFSFDIAQAEFSRQGDNLIVQHDGSQVIVSDFFITGGESKPLPAFRLPDGNEIPGAEVLSAANPDMDLTTAAGPSSSVSSSGGTYDDSTGSLIGGMDRLGSLGSEQWDKTEAMGREYSDQPLLASGPGEGEGGTPGTGGGGGIDRPAGHYVRVVLYNPGNETDPVTSDIFYRQPDGTMLKLSASDIDFNGSNPGAPYSVQTSVPEGWNASWLDIVFNPATGRMEFRLTAEGIAELQRLGLEGKDLVNFVKVTVIDEATRESFDYNVEFVGTDDPNFNSAQHDKLFADNTNSESLGEYHQGKDQTGSYAIQSSTRDDEIILNDTVIGGSSIHASGSPAAMGDDYNTIRLNEGVSNTEAGKVTHITSTDGELHVSKGMAAENGGKNLVEMGKGDVFVNNATHTVTATANSQNDVSGGNITVNGSIQGVKAQGGNSKNTLTAENDLYVSGVSRAVVAYDGGENHLSGTNVTIEARRIAGLEASGSGSKNVITAENTVKISGPGAVGAGDSAENWVSGKNVILGGSVVAGSSGRNTITAGESLSVTNTGYQDSAVTARTAGINELHAKDLTVTGGLYGVYATDNGSKNTLTALPDGPDGGNLTIRTAVRDGVAVQAEKNGLNELSGRSVTISASGGNAVNALENGVNEITASDTITIVSTYTGLLAEGAGSRNDVKAEKGGISITGNAKGVAADGAGAVNVITAREDTVTISGGTGNGNANTNSGISSTAGGANEVYGSNIVASGYYGVLTNTGGSTTIDASASVDIKGAWIGASTHGSGSYLSISGEDTKVHGKIVGVHIYQGTTDIQGKTVTLSGEAQSGVTNNGTLVITAEEEFNALVTDATSSASAINHQLDASTTITSGGNINATATATNSSNIASGVEIYMNTGSFLMQAENNIVISAENTATAYGIRTVYGGSSDFISKHGNITIDAHSTSSSAYGIDMYSDNRLTNVQNITAKEGTVTINVRNDADHLFGAIGINNTGTVNVTAKNVEFNVILASGSNYNDYTDAAAIVTYDGNYVIGQTNIIAEEAFKATVTGGGNASGIKAAGSLNATNTITAGSLELNVTSTGVLDNSRAIGLESSWMSTNAGGSSSGGNNIVNVTKDALINVTGKGLAAGFYNRQSDGRQELTAGGEVEMKVTSTAGDAYGIYGKGSITAGSVIMTVKGELSATALNGAATITATTVSITAESGSGDAYGMYAINGGLNQILATDATVSSGKDGLFAGQAGKNLINASGEVTVSGGDNGAAMHAVKAGAMNEVYGKTVTITDGKYGLFAEEKGKNQITAQDDLTITGVSRYGAYATAEGQNELSGRNVTIESEYWGLVADGKNSRNTVKATNDVTLTVDGGSTNYVDGIGHNDGGSTYIEAGGDVTLNATGRHATGIDTDLRTTCNSSTDIIAGGEVYIGATALSGSASGIYSWMRNNSGASTRNDVDISAQNDVTVAATSTNGNANGIYIYHYASGNNFTDVNITSASGDIKVMADATNGNAYGVYTNIISFSRDLSTITLDADRDVVITAAATGAGKAAYGQYDDNGSTKLDMTAGQNVTVKASSSGGDAYGIYHGYSGTTVMTAERGDVTITATSGNGNATGASSLLGDITATAIQGDLLITAHSDKGEATAVHTGNSTFTAANNIRLTATSGEGDARAFSTNYSNGTTFTAGKEILVEAVAENGTAYGLDGARYSSGGAKLDAESVVMTITGKHGAFGLTGSIIVTADKVLLTAVSEDGVSYGMYGTSQGASTIQSHEGRALDLEINADFAMHATNSKNVITGNSQSGGDGDSVRINGDIYGAPGSNVITTGAGDDVIVINGSIAGPSSGAGALHIDGGAGSDTLVLVAGSVEEFIQRYGDWLNNLSGSILKNIENIEISGLDDVSALRPALDDFFNYAESQVPPIPVAIQGATDIDSFSAVAEGDIDQAQHYNGDFDDNQDLGGSSHNFGSGKDALHFHDGVQNGELDMGHGSDTVMLGGEVDNIAINLGAGDDHLFLEGVVTISDSSGILGGSGTDVLHLDGLTSLNGQDVFGPGNGISLADLAGSGLSGFDVIDMTGGSENMLDIGDLLPEINATGKLVIKGDEGMDSVSLGNGWEQQTNVTDDGVTYSTYTNESGEELLIQQNIIIVTSS